MERSVQGTCPSCSAPTQARQRWCLECGAEVRPGRRAGLRSGVGIATALAVLVGAGSAAGYTLLQDGKEPPPPATTVAQQAPPAVTTPATQEPAPYTPPAYSTPTYTTPSSSPTTSTSGGSSTSGSSTTTGGAEDGDGAVTGTGGSNGTGNPQTIEPQLTLTDIALGAVAVVYAPYAAANVDLGDASRVVDATTRTVWKTPASDDPTASPQVGVYVDLASPEEIRKLVIRTPTPGMAIEVYGARKGPPLTIVDEGWDHLATRKELRDEAKIKLPARSYRYVLVWVTGLPPGGGRAAISELSLFSLQPE